MNRFAVFFFREGVHWFQTLILKQVPSGLAGSLLMGLSLIFLFTAPSWAQQDSDYQALTLDRAIQLAHDNDPWLAGNLYSQQAMNERAQAATSLPSPKVSLEFANWPTDSFDFNQEPMTQFRVQVSQMFPRGDSLAIDEKKLRLLSSQFPYQRQDRRAKVSSMVSQRWLDAYKAQESIELIENNRALFEQLVDLAQSRYSTAVGRSRQQDLIRAQLELTRLEDRLTILRLRRDQALADLLEWTGGLYESPMPPVADLGLPLSVARELPKIKVLDVQAMGPASTFVDTEMLPRELWFLLNHPAVKALDRRHDASNAEVELMGEEDKPLWGLNVGYGFRGEDLAGDDRADFLSVGVNFDLPLVTKNRQNHRIKAAVAGAAAVHMKKQLLLKNLLASMQSAQVALEVLTSRQALFETQLLPQLSDQSEASLTAYTYDDGDFDEVVRARIGELNAQIEALSIVVDRLKIIARLNYFYSEELPIANVAESNRASSLLEIDDE